MVPAASKRLAEKKTCHQVPDQEQAGEQGKGIGEEMIQGGSSYVYLCKNSYYCNFARDEHMACVRT